MKRLLPALALACGPALAGEPIPVGGDSLFGARLGGAEDVVVARLIEALGPPTEDTGRIGGCELNGVDERFVDWGGLTAHFEATETGEMVFMRWTYQLHWETGKPIPGGPAPGDIVLPQGVRIGDRFSDAALVYGFEPVVDDIFSVAMHFTGDFGIMTTDPSIDAPITKVGTPGFAFCE